MQPAKYLLLVPMLAISWAASASPPPLRCVIEPDRAAQIGSAVTGVVESVRVDRGDTVREGQLLAQLRASVEPLRAIRAPFSGVIADRYVNAGERVDVKPMFRLVKIDVLRVEIIAPAVLFGSIRKGIATRVTPDLPNASDLAAKVVLVDKIIDALSNTFRVRAELPNRRGSVPSGLRCKAEFAGLPEIVPAESLVASRGARTLQKPLAVLKMDTTLSLRSN
jgi:multidrug efflux pump subunit AcrA (membrane-fusion protein)